MAETCVHLNTRIFDCVEGGCHCSVLCSIMADTRTDRFWSVFWSVFNGWTFVLFTFNAAHYQIYKGDKANFEKPLT